jgi:hypothetical protein
LRQYVRQIKISWLDYDMCYNHSHLVRTVSGAEV